MQRRVALVGGDVSIDITDIPLRDAIYEIPYGPHIVDHIACTDSGWSASTVAGYDAVIVSQSVVSADVGTKLNSTKIPCMTTERLLYDDWNFASASSPVSETQQNITNPTHPIAAGYSGLTAVLSSVNSLGYINGSLASDLVTISEDVNGNGPAVFVVEKGGSLLSGTAPERRGMMCSLNLSGNTINTAGLDIFKKMIEWLLYIQ